MADTPALLDEARSAFKRREWLRALDAFTEAREDQALDADDLFALGDAAWWLGRLATSIEALGQAHLAYLREGRAARAAMAALNIAYTLSLRGDLSVASGWMSRATRLLEESPDCAEQGYLGYIEYESAFATGDLDAALAAAREVGETGRRFSDPDLTALGLLGEGRVLVRQGHISAGMRLLDEAMLAALSDELDPTWAGNIYCHLIMACYEIGDLGRAGEWTEATMRWCESLPGSGPFIGICRMHRAQVLQLRGEWEQAEDEASRVCREFSEFHVAIVAEAYYQLGEVHRRRGDLGSAEEAYRAGHRWGREPQPGLALLRLTQGRVAAAAASVSAALATEVSDPLTRVQLLAAQVEIAVAANDLETARRTTAELAETAQIYGGTAIKATALQARGSLLSAEGGSADAIPVLRAALSSWQELNALYDAARVRILLAAAARTLGDQEAAALELEAAEATFARLGARLDLARARELRRPTLPAGLSQREAEVLALIAAGKSNREIAESMVISAKTVARHLSNIFTKLDVSSRTAAAAYAYEHGLASPSRDQTADSG